MQNYPLTDKVALVTGGARRIGEQIVRRLHGDGMRVVIHYRASSTEAEKLHTQLNAARPESALLVKGDLLDAAVPERLVLETINGFGRLDALVNNASTFYPTPLDDATDEQWQDLLGINLKAPFFLAQAGASALTRAQGCIVNIADIYGQRPLKSHSIYCTAKAGLIMLTRALARDLAPSVRVNAVAPGAVLWPEGTSDEVTRKRIVSRTPLKRMGKPEEIAAAVAYLIGDATFVSGQVVVVDGGRSIAS